MKTYTTIEDAIGRTPLVVLQRIGAQDKRGARQRHPGRWRATTRGFGQGHRPAVSMIRRAEERGEIRPGDTLIEATSGNTGIALAMAGTSGLPHGADHARGPVGGARTDHEGLWH